ncbi:hypothetical protein AURDEDRAFT_130939 [Auricularia subglabra TFB-10046 SS5]|nr:hypothetical protein AURDEDRAFT_130939 [Auricularia subglabra TFB-10046 SS5]
MCSSDSDAPDVAAAMQVGPHSTDPHLPPELVLRVLKHLSHRTPRTAIAQHLPQKDLRAASQASHAFYGLALAAGLYIQRSVKWNSIFAFRETLATLDQVLDHAAEKPALNIAVLGAFSYQEEMDSVMEAAIQRFLASVRRALPYLVRLHLSFPHCVPGTVYASFCEHPAPRLYHLGIDHCMGSPVHIPYDLFSGHAPLLREVSLGYCGIEHVLESAPVAVFQRVTHLTLYGVEAQNLFGLAHVFPASQVLAISASRTQKLDLSGLRLRYLALDYDDVLLIDRSVLASIPIIEHNVKRGINTVWPAPCGPICAQVEIVEYKHGTSPAVSFGARDGSWRRTFALPPQADLNVALPLADAPMLASKLVSITLGKSFVNAFIQAPVVLAALRELFLDVSANGSNGYCWPSVGGVRFDELTPSVRCPALARVVILAIPSGHPVTVVPTKATRFGRALGLRDGRPTKPMLVLAGCTFNMEPIWTALEELFAAVDVVECSGNCIPEYYRSCRYSGYFLQREWEAMGRFKA